MRKFVYLISPKKISSNFYNDLHKVLAAKNVKFFQLRLKKIKVKETIQIVKKTRKILKKYSIKLIINDNPYIAKITNADGCHLGQKDGSILNAKKYLKRQIVGVTCHNSKSFAKIAIKNKADYLAFGSFNKSKLKPRAKKANINILK